MPKKRVQKIDETLQRIAAGISKANSPTSSNSDLSTPHIPDLPGDPNCPQCHGLGYLRMDLPLGHPDFGRLEICSCRHAELSQQIRQRLFKLSQLEQLDHLTFDNFNPRGRVGMLPRQADSIEQAYNQAHHFAQHMDGWLLLQGGYGCGKTHLAAAIANFTVSLGVPTLFITVPDLLDSLRFAYQDPEATFEERFEEIRQAPLLVMDDFGTQNATPWAQEKLFQIINYRYTNRLPLVVTTNLPFEQIEGRIRSRLDDRDWVTIVRITATDYRNPLGNMGHPEISSLELLHKCTFASFNQRKNENIPVEDLHRLEKAFQAARQFAENPRGWLVLMGNYNTGKTHLAAAIGNFLTDQGSPPVFVGISDLLDHLRAAFGPSSTITLDQRFEEVRTASLLILDDLGKQYATPWASEKLYQLLNFRYNAELPTVITTYTSLEEMDPRLRSRMLDKRLCSIYSLTVPPYTGDPPTGQKSPTRRSRSK